MNDIFLQRPFYIAYYTVDTLYEEDAKRLRKSLELFELDHEIEGVSNLGSWQRNTQFKPTFIEGMMEKHPGRPLVYLDADAEVKQYPELFDRLDCDIAAHMYENKEFKFWELLSGTLYLGPTEKAKKIVKRWIEINQKKPAKSDQTNLQYVLLEMPEIRFYELPPSYALIFDLMSGRGPAVIVHHQSSRRLK